jgi:hypothetical protein
MTLKGGCYATTASLKDKGCYRKPLIFPASEKIYHYRQQLQIGTDEKDREYQL